MIERGKSFQVETMGVLLVTPELLRLSGSLQSSTGHVTFRQLVERLHEHIVARSISSFSIDVRELSFVNSSALRAFIDWAKRARGASYKLVFITDASVTWHRLSFSVLQSMVPEHVEIHSDRPGAGPPP